ncbi:ribosome biogenesis GTP-binding protein YsxC, partial [bacterium]|nr:ribosome biogenesis GTP-binding protein YsxC [bacterium]
SSFICKFTNQKIAKVSSTPGKTRLINYFLINENWYLVDLPGYGFAKVSKAEKERWGRSLEEFLAKRSGIRLAILLVDCRHEVKDSDLQMYDWLCNAQLPVLIILTKTDKISKQQLIKAKARAAQTFKLPIEQILSLSILTGNGLEEINKYLEKVLATKL